MRELALTVRVMYPLAVSSSSPSYLCAKRLVKPTIDRRGSCKSWDATYANCSSSAFDRANSWAWRVNSCSAARVCSYKREFSTAGAIRLASRARIPCSRTPYAPIRWLRKLYLVDQSGSNVKAAFHTAMTIPVRTLLASESRQGR